MDAKKQFQSLDDGFIHRPLNFKILHDLVIVGICPNILINFWQILCKAYRLPNLHKQVTQVTK